MLEYCPYCKTKRKDTDLFCKNCGFKILENKREINSFESEIAYPQENIFHSSNMNNSYYNQYEPIKNKSTRKFLAIGLTVLIAAMLLSVAFFVILNNETEIKNEKNEIEEPDEIKTPVEPEVFDQLEDGPKVSFHSLAGGTITSIPQQGATAIYGLYDENGIFGKEGKRIGQIIETNMGEKYYNGEKCILIRTEGEIYFSLNEILDNLYIPEEEIELLNDLPDKVSFYIYSDYYVKPADHTPVYMDYKIDLTEYFEFFQLMYTMVMEEASTNEMPEDEMAMEEHDEFMDLFFDTEEVIIGMETTWNKNKNNVESRYYIEGFSFMSMNINFSIEFSDEYWEMNPKIEELHVGFEKIITYTMELTITDYSFSFSDFEEEEYYYDDYYDYEEEYDDYYDYEEEYDDYYYEPDLYNHSYSIENNMRFKVIDKKDLTLDSGKYKDCFVIEIQEIQNNIMNSYDYYEYEQSSSTKLWITQEGFLIKAEYSLLANDFMGSSNSEKFIIILEEYIK